MHRHVEDALLLLLPLGHGVQLVEPSTLKLPAEHGVQTRLTPVPLPA